MLMLNKLLLERDEQFNKQGKNIVLNHYDILILLFKKLICILYIYA